MLRKQGLAVSVFLLISCIILVGCVKVKGEGRKDGGSQKPTISYDVAKEAKVTNFQYYLKEWEKKQTLFYKITINNISDKIHRYRVVISIPDGDSVGGLLPASPNAKFQPGKEESAEYPVLENNQIPEKIEVSVIVMD